MPLTKAKRTPLWVPRYGGIPVPPSTYLDFTRQLYWSDGFVYPTVTPLIACTRSGAGLFDDGNSNWISFGTNVPRITARGLTTGPSRTNSLLWSRDLTNAVWTKTNCTVALNQIGIDGTVNAATLVTVGSAGATISQAITLASGIRAGSLCIRKANVNSAGTIQLSIDGGSTFTTLTVADNFTQISAPSQTLANPTFIIKFTNSSAGDTYVVDGCQVETPGASTEQQVAAPIFTTSAAVTRNLDDITFAGNLLRDTISTVGTIVINVAQAIAGTGNVLLRPSNNSAAIQVRTDTLARSSITANLDATAAAGGWSTGGKVAFSWDPAGRNIVFNGGVVASDTNTMSGNTSVRLGQTNSGSQSSFPVVREIAVFKGRRFSGAALQAATLVYLLGPAGMWAGNLW